MIANSQIFTYVPTTPSAEISDPFAHRPAGLLDSAVLLDEDEVAQVLDVLQFTNK